MVELNLVEKTGKGSYTVMVPVYFTVMMDDDGRVKSVHQANSDRKWVKNGHNKFGNGYSAEPTGLLASAARTARLAFLKS